MLKLQKAITLAMFVAASALMSTTASAQATDRWQFGAVIYGWFPSIDGTTNFPASGGSPSVEVDVDQILDNLKFVIMGSFEAKKGRWGGFTDLMYMDIGGNKSGTRDFSIGGIQIPASASGSLNLDLKGLIWTIAGEYAVVSQPGATTDVFVGARMVDLEQTIDWRLDGAIAGIPVASARGARRSAPPTGMASLA